MVPTFIFRLDSEITTKCGIGVKIFFCQPMMINAKVNKGR